MLLRLSRGPRWRRLESAMAPVGAGSLSRFDATIDRAMRQEVRSRYRWRTDESSEGGRGAPGSNVGRWRYRAYISEEFRPVGFLAGPGSRLSPLSLEATSSQLLSRSTEKNARLRGSGFPLVEAHAVRHPRRSHHECVCDALSPPVADAPWRDVQQSRRSADANLAVALDVDRHEGVGSLPPQAPRVCRPRGRSTQPAARRIAQYHHQGRVLLSNGDSSARHTGEVREGHDQRLARTLRARSFAVVGHHPHARHRHLSVRLFRWTVGVGCPDAVDSVL